MRCGKAMVQVTVVTGCSLLVALIGCMADGSGAGDVEPDTASMGEGSDAEVSVEQAVISSGPCAGVSGTVYTFPFSQTRAPLNANDWRSYSVERTDKYKGELEYQEGGVMHLRTVARFTTGRISGRRYFRINCLSARIRQAQSDGYLNIFWAHGKADPNVWSHGEVDFHEDFTSDSAVHQNGHAPNSTGGEYNGGGGATVINPRDWHNYGFRTSSDKLTVTTTIDGKTTHTFKPGGTFKWGQPMVISGGLNTGISWADMNVPSDITYPQEMLIKNLVIVGQEVSAP